MSHVQEFPTQTLGMLMEAAAQEFRRREGSPRLTGTPDLIITPGEVVRNVAKIFPGPTQQLVEKILDGTAELVDFDPSVVAQLVSAGAQVTAIRKYFRNVLTGGLSPRVWVQRRAAFVAVETARCIQPAIWRPKRPRWVLEQRDEGRSTRLQRARLDDRAGMPD